MFVPGKPFQPSLMFAGKAGSYPSEHLSGAPILSSLLDSPTNAILAWKGFPRTNPLAYYENPKITAVKSFIVQAPGAWTIQTFTALIN